MAGGLPVQDKDAAPGPVVLSEMAQPDENPAELLAWSGPKFEMPAGYGSVPDRSEMPGGHGTGRLSHHGRS
jgi:hypothetical protein